MRSIALVLAALAVGWGPGTVSAAPAPSIEYQVKAAYLAKFVPFVQWPTGSMGPAEPLNICVAGNNPFGPALQALGRQTVGERRIAVRLLTRPEQAVECHVLYARAAAREALTIVKGRPVLTVTDAADGAGAARGILHFVIDRNRVRFEVDAEAASENQLAISSKLQSLAVSPGRTSERP